MLVTCMVCTDLCRCVQGVPVACMVCTDLSKCGRSVLITCMVCAESACCLHGVYCLSRCVLGVPVTCRVCTDLSRCGRSVLVTCGNRQVSCRNPVSLFLSVIHLENLLALRFNSNLNGFSQLNGMRMT